jgi:hypothetical protein
LGKSARQRSRARTQIQQTLVGLANAKVGHAVKKSLRKTGAMYAVIFGCLAKIYQHNLYLNVIGIA